MAEDEAIRLAERPVSIVPHMSEEESKARGKEARAKAPRASHATFEPAADRPDPVSLLEEQATTRVPELVPIRYGRMLVSPFTFFRGAALVMASDLSTHAALGPHRAALRGRPPLQLRRVRVARAPARLRLQRLRRDAPGALGVGHQAPGGERRDRRPQQGPLQVGADRCDRGAGSDVPGVDAPDGDHVEPGGLVLPRGRGGGPDLAASPRRPPRARRCRRAWRRTATKLVEKARTKDSMKALDKLTHVVDGERRHHQRSTPGGADRGALPRGGVRAGGRHVPGHPAPVPPEPVDRPPAPAGEVPLQPDGPQGGRGGQRRHQGLGDPPARRQPRGRPVPAGQGGGGVGPGALHQEEPRTATTGPGWSPASA